MAAKKKAAKKKTGKQQNHAGQPGRKILGADITQLGAAIASAVVAELAQTAITKTTRSLNDSGQADHVSHSVKNAAASVKTAIEDTSPAIKEAVVAIKDALQSVPSSATETAEAVKEVPKDAAEKVGETINAAKDVAEDSAHPIEGVLESAIGLMKNPDGEMNQSLQDTIKGIADTVKENVTHLTPEKNGKKNKKAKKRSGKKKAKKNKK